MVNRKRTYSHRDKQAAELDARRKRSKSGDEDGLRLPDDRQTKAPQKACYLLKKGLMIYGSPTPLPNDESNTEIEQESNKKHSIWNKTLKGKLKSVNQKQPSIYGSREIFVETMKDNITIKKSNSVPTKDCHPTPPSELQKKQGQHLNRFFPNLNGAASKLVPSAKTSTKGPTATPKPAHKIAQKDELKHTYVMKQYESDKVSAPHKNILGYRLSSRSTEAEL
jgi:hypothetical protein